MSTSLETLSTSHLRDLTVNVLIYTLKFLIFILFVLMLYVQEVLFDLILYVPSTIFQLNRDRSSWVEPVLS